MSHTYVVDDFIWHVRSWGERAEVFFHTVVPSNWRAEKTRWLRIFATNFPEEPPVTAELFEERKAQVLGVPRATYAVKRVQGPPCGTPSAPPQLSHIHRRWRQKRHWQQQPLTSAIK